MNTLNLMQFLKQVDSLAATMSKSAFQAFLHEYARILPESKRESFITLIQTFQTDGIDCTDVENVCDPGLARMKERDLEQQKTFIDEVRGLMEMLEEINNGEKILDSEINEEYDDWYNPDAPEFIFYDSDSLLPDIEKGITLVHSCIDIEEYALGYELAEFLSSMNISVRGEYMECIGEDLDISKLYDNDLLQGDIRHLLIESMYLAYMANEPECRPDAMFLFLGNYDFYSVRLEDIMQLGNHDLPDFQTFLPKWISFLGKKSGRGIESLLKEAQSMLENEYQLLENARKFVNKHPELYLQILQQDAGQGEKRVIFTDTDYDNNRRYINIGLEALDSIPENWTIRSEIALLMAEYADRMNHEDSIKEYGWLEAFRSDTTVVNYLRVKLCTEKPERKNSLIKEIYKAVYKETKARVSSSGKYYDIYAKKENSLYKNDYLILEFFEKDFDYVVNAGLNETVPLGWSSSFMKTGFSLFLLLMYQGNIEHLPVGLYSMLKKAVTACRFRTQEYIKGRNEEDDRSDSDLFWAIFCDWKENIPLSEDNVNQWLTLIKDKMEMRVKGIMETNRRNYYGECASYIAAIGEVEESLGRKGEKSRIMEHYRSTYPKRRAFHQEMRNYGMS